MPLSLLSRYPSGTWRGFLLRVAMIAVAAGIVLGIADWCDIPLDPMHPSRPHPAPYTEHTHPSAAPEP
jgi:hypothetical protein